MNAQKAGSKRLPLVMLASVLHSEDDATNLFDALLTKLVKPLSLFDALMTVFDVSDASRSQFSKQDKAVSFNDVELLADRT